MNKNNESSTQASDGLAVENDPPGEGSLKHRVRELSAIHHASLRLQRLRDPAELAQELIVILEEILQYDHGAVLLIDGDRLLPYALSDQGHGEQFIEQDKQYVDSLGFKLGYGITGWVAKNGVSALVPDVRTDPRFVEIRNGIVSELCVPMRSQNAVIGVVNIECRLANAYTESDRRVLEIVAAQIAIAIDNAFLYERARHTQKLQMLAELSGGIAHDLGNLMAVISMECTALGALLVGDDPLRQRISQVNEATSRAIDLTRRLMNFGRRELHSELLDLNQIIEDAGPLIHALVGPQIDVKIETEAVSPIVRADTGQIEQVLMNLVINAREAMSEYGRLTIRTEDYNGGIQAGAKELRAGKYVRWKIQDDGCGMDEATGRRILTPFFTTRSDGAGLGLSTVARIVRQLEGGLSYESELGRGTEFCISLPLAQQED